MPPTDEKCEKHTLELLSLKREQEEQARSINRHKVLADAIDIKLSDHVKTSVERVEKMVRHDEQIITLEKANVAIMEDLKSIRTEISGINISIKDLQASMKIWVLSGICGTVLVFSIPTMTLFYSAGQMSRQIEINTKKLEHNDKAGVYAGHDTRSPVGN
jgi:hypothetical protein